MRGREDDVELALEDDLPGDYLSEEDEDAAVAKVGRKLI